MKYNRPMEIYISTFKNDFGGKTLSPLLTSLISGGFKKIDGACILQSLPHNEGDLNKKYFNNAQEYEDFINHIHVEDFVNEDVFNQAFLYIYNLAKKWEVYNPDVPMIINCSFDVEQNSARVSFHTTSSLTEFYPENLNSYDEPFLIVSSSDIKEMNI